MALFLSSGAVSTGSTALTPGYPSGVALGNKLCLHVANKYPGASPVTPVGWTAPANNQASGGAGASGPDSGSVLSTVFTKIADAADVIASAGLATLAVSIPGANSSMARIYRYAKQTPTSTWNESLAVGSDSVPGVSWVATGNVDPGISAGDILLTFSAINSDTSTVTGHAYTVPGCSFNGPITERLDFATSVGDDLASGVTDGTCHVGPSTGVPVYTATRSSTSGNAPAGATVFVRLREVGGTDGPNGWRVPSCGRDFEDVGETPLRNVWPCQVVGVTTIGSDIGQAWQNATVPGNLNLNPFGDTATLGLYDETVSGWARKAIGGNDGDQITWRRSFNMLTIGTQSGALTSILTFPALPPITRPFMALASDETPVMLSLRADGKLELKCQANITIGQTNYVDGSPHWFCFYFDRTAGVVALQTDRELITGVYDPAVAGGTGNAGWGYVQNTAIDTPSFRMLWAGHAIGASAERNWRTFLENMGVSVASPGRTRIRSLDIRRGERVASPYSEEHTFKGRYFEADCLTTDSVGDFVRITGDPVSGIYQVSKVSIDTPTHMPAIGVITAKTTLTRCFIQTQGIYVVPGLISGLRYWISTSSQLTSMMPSPTPGNTLLAQVAGQSISDTELILTLQAHVVKLRG